MGELFGSSVKSLLQQDPPPLPNEAELLDAVVQKVGPFADKDKLCYHIRISAGKVHWAVNSYFRNILASAWPAREDFDSKPNSNQHAAADRPAAAAAAAGTLTASIVPAPAGAGLSGEAATALGGAAVPRGSVQGQHAACSSCSPGAGQSAAAASSGSVAQQFSGAAAADAQRSTVDAAAAASPAVQLDALPGNVVECVLSYLELPSLLHAAASCKALNRAAQAERLWRQLFLQRWGAVIFPTSKHSSRMNSSRGSAGRAAVVRDTGDYPVSAGSVGAAVAQGKHGSDSTGRSERQIGEAAAASGTGGLQAAKADGGAAGSLPRRHIPAGGGSSSTFVSRWTGSCLTGPGAVRAAGGASSSSSSVPQPALPLPLPQQQQQQLRQQAAPAAACISGLSPQQVGTAASSTGVTCHSWGCTCGSCSALPAAAPSGSWRLQYKQQHSYQSVRRCPKCGEATVVPIVYGFPSGPLLAGMGLKRLVLGGDHLIDSCHVWACSGCRSCFRFFPYADVQLWLQDDEAQQRWDQARAAAGRSSGRRGGGGGAAAAGGGGSQQQDGGEAGDGAGDAAQADAAAAAAGFPRYTYEL